MNSNRIVMMMMVAVVVMCVRVCVCVSVMKGKDYEFKRVGEGTQEGLERGGNVIEYTQMKLKENSKIYHQCICCTRETEI